MRSIILFVNFSVDYGIVQVNILPYEFMTIEFMRINITSFREGWASFREGWGGVEAKSKVGNDIQDDFFSILPSPKFILSKN